MSRSIWSHVPSWSMVSIPVWCHAPSGGSGLEGKKEGMAPPEQTVICKNITFPQLRLRVLKCENPVCLICLRNRTMEITASSKLCLSVSEIVTLSGDCTSHTWQKRVSENTLGKCKFPNIVKYSNECLIYKKI